MAAQQAFDQAWSAVRTLAEQFRANKAHFLSADYQEAHVRKDFIDKFFKILGWDVDHERELDPWRQEVKIEKPEHKAKGRADYSFAIAPHFRRVQFFVEAKRPLESIATPDNCFQVIRYSWPKGAPIAVLTDFKGLHIVDSRFKPNINTATSRIVRSWNYADYHDQEKFAEVYWLLSREAVASGSIDNFAQNQLPTAEVAVRQYTLFAGEAREFDDYFLQKLDEWRNDLASNFKSVRSSLTGEQLTECVQRTLDRLLFIRFLEDKYIEQHRIVEKFGLKHKTHWSDFVAVCARLDRTYNGIVFKRHPILDDSEFEPKGAVFAEICDELSDQHSPYNFDSIPVEILGRIYERFLGKIVKLKGKAVTVEEKPDVRKAGGVYYTPDYIVAYMAEQALAPLIGNKKPENILKLRAIDTACGSGSFLIGTYAYLLQAITRYWRSRPDDAKKGTLDIREGQVHLTLKYRREVLVRCIYGIDIDPQAVEVAQLSLYLKLLEEETTHSAKQQQMEIGAALLPSLAENIVVANSLLSSTKSIDLFEQVEATVTNLRMIFAEPFASGGFDLVIGNPPYIKEYTNREAFDHVRSSPYYEGKMDIWYMFACTGMDWLKPKTGTIAYIATNNWVTNAGAKILRSKITTEARIEQLVDFGNFKVFRDAGIQTMILIARKDKTPTRYEFDYRRLSGNKPTLVQAQALLEKAPTAACEYLTPMFDRRRNPRAPFSFSTDDIESVLDKIAEKTNFQFDGDREIAQGIVAPQDTVNKKAQAKLGPKFKVGQGIFILTEQERKALHLTKEEKHLVKPFYTTAELSRYFGSSENKLWVIYTDSRFADSSEMTPYPNLRRHLDQFGSVITSHYRPYGLHRARDERFFIGEKIMSVRKCLKPTFTFTDFPCYVSQTFNVIKSDRVNLRYLTALLNSRVVRFWLRHRGKMQGHHFQIDKEPLLAIPLHVPAASVQRKIATSVENLIAAHEKSHAESITESQRTRLERTVIQIDSEIQDTIDDLYTLSSADQDLMARSDQREFGANEFEEQSEVADEVN